MHYRSFGYTQEDNFTRLDIDKTLGTLTIRVFNRDGKGVRVDGRDGQMTMQNVLQFARWD
jgi:alkaline phosphatase D